MFEFDPPEETNKTAPSAELHQGGGAGRTEQASTAEPRVELLPGVDMSNMTVSEFLAVGRLAPERLPASAFAHLTDPHELGQALFEAQGRYHPFDPEFQTLILAASGTFYGNLVAARLAPRPNAPAPKPRPLPRKRRQKGWKPPMTNLITIAAELAADNENN